MSQHHSTRRAIYYLLPSLDIGGVEVAAAKARDALSKELDLTYATIRAPKSNMPLMQSTPLSVSFLAKLFFRRHSALLVTSLWPAHLVGLFLAGVGVPWIAFFHSAKNAGSWHSRAICWLAFRYSSARLFDSDRTRNSFDPATTSSGSYVVPFIFPRPTLAITQTAVREIDLLFVGRFVEVKRIDLCIALVSESIRLLPTFKAAFVGYGELEPDLVKFAQTHPDNVAIHGVMPPNAAMLMMSSSKCILCLSDFEGMAMSVVEGIQAGCIPIVRPVGEIPHYAPPTSAIYCIDPNEIPALAQELVALVGDSVKLEEMKAQGSLMLNQYVTYPDAFLHAMTAISNKASVKSDTAPKDSK